MFKEKRKKVFAPAALIFAMIFALTQNCWAVMSFTNNATTLKSGISSSTITNMNTTELKKTEEQINLNNVVKVTNSNAKINISLRDSNARQVLRMLADKAKLNIIFHDSAEDDKKVTLDLVDTPLNDAFMYVFQSCELSYILNGSTLIVLSSDATKTSSFAKQVLTTVPIKYVNADNVADFLNDNIFSANLTGLTGDKVVTSNPRTNEIMIFGTKSDAEVAQKVIAKLDTKPMINTFRVSHVTPKEMADLLCSTLFASESGGGGGGGGGGGAGGALSIGGGTVACKVGGAETNGTAVAFKGQVATLVYLDQQGEISLYGGSYEQARMVKDFIVQHDIRQPMAYIEMNVIELNESGSNEFSSSWTIDVPFGQFKFDPDTGVEINDVTVFDGDGWKWFVGDQTSKAVTTLKWLLKDGKGRVLSNPKIMVTNGQTSTIDMTSDYVKTVTTEFTQSTLSTTPITTRTYEVGDDNGFKIELTPFISPEGYVTLNLMPDFATIKEKVYTKAVDETSGKTYDDLAVTLLQRRNLELKNIRIKDGETLILAGYVQEEETQAISKMPFLGDLPLLGVLFRRTSNAKARSELVITITPHIVYSEEEAAALGKTKL